MIRGRNNYHLSPVNCFAEEGGGDVGGGDHAAGAGEGDIDPLLAGEADDPAADTSELARHDIDLVVRAEMRWLRPKKTDMKIVRGSGQDGPFRDCGGQDGRHIERGTS